MTARRRAWRSGWRAWLALATCYLLVVQAMVAGLSVTGHAAAGGALAAVICTPDGVRAVPGDGGVPARSQPMSCCLIGCSAAGPTVAPPPATDAVLAAPSAASSRLEIAPPGATVPGQRWSPGSARAPPATA